MMESSINWDVNNTDLEAEVYIAERDYRGYNGSKRCIGS